MLGVYVNKFRNKSVAWGHTSQSMWPNGIALEYAAWNELLQSKLFLPLSSLLSERLSLVYIDALPVPEIEALSLTKLHTSGGRRNM